MDRGDRGGRGWFRTDIGSSVGRVLRALHRNRNDCLRRPFALGRGCRSTVRIAGLILRILCGCSTLDHICTWSIFVCDANMKEVRSALTCRDGIDDGVRGTYRSWTASLRLAPATHSLQHPPSLRHLETHSVSSSGAGVLVGPGNHSIGRKRGRREDGRIAEWLVGRKHSVCPEMRPVGMSSPQFSFTTFRIWHCYVLRK